MAGPYILGGQINAQIRYLNTSQWVFDANWQVYLNPTDIPVVATANGEGIKLTFTAGPVTFYNIYRRTSGTADPPTSADPWIKLTTIWSPNRVWIDGSVEPGTGTQKFEYLVCKADFSFFSEVSNVHNGDLLYKSSDETAEVSNLPEEFGVDQNYPNPFNPSTNIKFGIVDAGEVSLIVYDILGKEVATLVNRNLEIGFHTVQFNAVDLPSGIYIYRLSSNGQSISKKLSLIK